MTGRGTRLARPFVLAAVAIGLVLGGLHLTGRDGPLAVVENLALDWRFRMVGARPPPTEVAIVAVDDRSISIFGRFPLPRAVLADAIDRLNRAGATAIGADLLFLEREQPSDGIRLAPGDQALRDRMRGIPTVLAAAAVFDGRAAAAERPSTAVVRGFGMIAGSRPDLTTLPQASGILLPIPPFVDVTTPGHVNVALEAGALQGIPLAIAVVDVVVPAFPLQAARLALGLQPESMTLLPGRAVELGDRRIAADFDMLMPIAYYGPEGTVATHSLADLVAGRIPDEAFAGRLVMIGATAAGAGDRFSTPFDAALPGVEAMATASANILSGEGLVRNASTRALSALAALLLSVAAFFVANLKRLPIAVVGACLLFAAWPVAAHVAFMEGWWLDATVPSVGVAVVAVTALAARSFAERRLSRRLGTERDNLARYHSPLIADLLADSAKPEFDEREQPVAILFVDVAGFTSRSERLGPAGTMRFLRQFHARIEEAALDYGGTVEQFTGDGAMIIFGLPKPDPTDPVRALACAHALIEDCIDWSCALVEAGEEVIRVGAGVHYGPAVVARLGGRIQRQMTAAGDTVNVASRLQALTRSLDAWVVVSDAAHAAILAARRGDLVSGYELRPEERIRGRVEPISVWALDRAHPPSAKSGAVSPSPP